jgi:hypothetical protein
MTYNLAIEENVFLPSSPPPHNYYQVKNGLDLGKPAPNGS